MVYIFFLVLKTQSNLTCNMNIGLDSVTKIKLFLFHIT